MKNISKYQAFNHLQSISVKKMSGLVDIWTSKVAKLRNNKGEAEATVSSSGSVPTSPGASQVNLEEERSTLGILSPIFAKLSPAAICSDTSVSMLVDCFSP
ncbi:unnamed protein product [Ilex paraguariensis]|uniref:Uncharacterized protein n=1 Tax=Ilex paraguariensis TaxID=185542 RepID=A0ABC8S6K7_9AQUA